MEIIVFSSDNFAFPYLEYLLQNPKWNLKAIITQPPRRKGRGLKVSSTSVKEWGKKRQITIYETENVNRPDFINLLRNLNADLFIVICFGQILGKEILSLPSKMAINLHPSLLPKYRGAAPINWAIINGERETGITIIKMNPDLDAGEIIIQKRFPIFEEDTALSLKERLSKEGVGVLEEALYRIKNNKFSLKPQQGRISYAPKLKKEDGLIDWRKSALEIHNMVRGLIPWPSAYCFWNGKMMKIWKTEVLNEKTDKKPGEIIKIDKNYIYVACGKDILKIKEIQLEGRKKIPVSAFILGYRIKTGQILSK